MSTASQAEIEGLDPAVRRHVEDLRQVILRAFPAADLRVYAGDDPVGLYVAVISDTEDGFDVLELVSDRLADLLVEEGVALHVVPVHRTPPEAPGAEGPAYRRYVAPVPHPAAQ